MRGKLSISVIVEWLMDFVAYALLDKFQKLNDRSLFLNWFKPSFLKQSHWEIYGDCNWEAFEFLLKFCGFVAVEVEVLRVLKYRMSPVNWEINAFYQ